MKIYFDDIKPIATINTTLRKISEKLSQLVIFWNLNKQYTNFGSIVKKPNEGNW